MNLVDDSIYDMSDKNLVRVLRAYLDHKRAVRSSQTWNPDHFLELVEEVVKRFSEVIDD